MVHELFGLKTMENANCKKSKLNYTTMQKIYGVVSGGIHTDTSKTERGAKIYATKNGFDAISVRYDCGYNVAIVAKKEGKKWVSK